MESSRRMKRLFVIIITMMISVVIVFIVMLCFTISSYAVTLDNHFIPHPIKVANDMEREMQTNYKVSREGRRVALCFYGQPRFFNATRSYAWIKKLIIDVYNPDVFFHTWWSEDDIGKKYASGPHMSLDVRTESDAIDKLVALYKPVRFFFEKSREFPKPPDYVYRRVLTKYVPTNVKSMYHSMKCVRDMKRAHEEENGFTYDWVIKMRFDVELFDMPYLWDLQRGVYHYPYIMIISCDCIAICSSEQFDALGDLFDDLSDLWNAPMFYPFIYFEGLHEAYLMKHSFKTKTVTWKFKYVRNYADKFIGMKDSRVIPPYSQGGFKSLYSLQDQNITYTHKLRKGVTPSSTCPAYVLQ